MIAANDDDITFLHQLAPDQLRSLLAHASGLLAHAAGDESAARTLYRIGDRLLSPGRQRSSKVWFREKRTLGRATVEIVLASIAEETGVSREEIMTGSRKPRVSHARQHAMYRLREMADEDGVPRFSYPEIGRAFGKDHTTVQHACRVTRRRLAEAQERAA